MNAIVRKTYPAANLPPDLREGLAADAVVTVTVEVEETSSQPSPGQFTRFAGMFADRNTPLSEAVKRVRDLRDEWS
jgi:hypothetical protein